MKDSEENHISIYLNCQEALKTALIRISETNDFRERRALIEEYFAWIIFPMEKQVIVAPSIEYFQELLLKYSDKKNKK